MAKILLAMARVPLTLISYGLAFLLLWPRDDLSKSTEVQLDGQPVPLYQTNGVMRGVFVPSGAHHVRFQFNPHLVAGRGHPCCAQPAGNWRHPGLSDVAEQEGAPPAVMRASFIKSLPAAHSSASFAPFRMLDP